MQKKTTNDKLSSPKPKRKPKLINPTPLDSSFYETLFNLETSFRKIQTPELIRAIMSKYIQAIEYYEHQQDQKCADFQNRLKQFITRPEVMKHLHKKKQTEIFVPTVVEPEVNKPIKNNEDLKIKFHFYSQIENLESNIKKNEMEVKRIIDIQNTEHDQQKATDLINDEINKQHNAFHERLKQIKQNKNKKTLPLMLAVNNDNIPIQTDKEEPLSLPDEQIEHEHENIDEHDNTNKQIENENNITDEQNKIIDNNEHNDNDNSSLSSIDDSFDNENTDHLNININARTSQLFEAIDSNGNIGPKQQKGFLEIKELLDNYVNNFNTFFYNELFSRFAKQTKTLMDEKFNKYIEITKMYQNQIQDIKSQMNEISNVDSQEYKALENAIESLKEEQRNELDVIEDEYNQKIDNAQKHFRQNEFKTHPGVLLLEEQFRLNMCNKISDTISPGM